MSCRTSRVARCASSWRAGDRGAPTRRWRSRRPWPTRSHTRTAWACCTETSSPRTFSFRTATRSRRISASPKRSVPRAARAPPPRAAPRRRYSGGEVQEIVQRAAELEATAPTAGGAMTIGGVEALAAEVGIARDVVRAAVQSLTPAGAVAPSEPPRSNRWLGGPTTLLFERVVEGEVPDSEWLGMVDEIRRALKNVGQVSQFGRSFSRVAARRGASQRDLEVAVSVRGGQTRITIRENLASLMGGGGVWPVIGIAIGLFHLPPGAIGAIIPLWLGTTYVTARTAYHASTKRRARAPEHPTPPPAAPAREPVSQPP